MQYNNLNIYSFQINLANTFMLLFYHSYPQINLDNLIILFIIIPHFIAFLLYFTYVFYHVIHSNKIVISTGFDKTKTPKLISVFLAI
jgi:hypothetical protein